MSSADSESEFDGFGPSDIDSDIDVNVSDVSSVSDVSDISSVDLSDDERDTDWTNNFTNLTFEEFREQPGPVLPDGFDIDQATPLDYFWLVFNPVMIETIVNHTNNYARWKMRHDGEEDPRWVETTVDEMRAFIAINILMGINSLPTADMFWSTNMFIGNQGVQNTMTCNRFQKLNQYLHISDRSAEPRRNERGYDKLFKVRPVMEHVAETFVRTYVPSREVAVDEAMIRYAGRLSFKQYMPAKPVKRGIKVWMMCDSRTGFMSRFQIYLGRQNNTEHGLGHNVVMRLTDGIRGTFRHVFFDNFFTGVPLMTALLDQGLYACGTVRTNRKGFPATLSKPRDLKNRGESIVVQKGDSHLTASVWRDKRLVHHLSTLSNPRSKLPAQRRVGAEVINLQQPHCVSVYNQYMGGVDLHDQYRMKYEVGRNSKKWWRYLFWFFVNCAIVNAFLLYKASSQRLTKKKRYVHLDFRLELVQELIAGYTRRKRALSELENVAPVNVNNLNGYVYGKLTSKPRRCRFHSKYLQQRTETKFGCTSCQIHLCRDGCHQRWHERQSHQ